MKVFNLTDVSTPLLERHGMLNQTIAVGTELINPGSSAEIGEEPHVILGAQHLVSIGALAFSQLPSSYVAAKAPQAPVAPPAAPEPTLEEPKPVEEPVVVKGGKKSRDS